MPSLFEIFTSLETETEQIETLKYSFEKINMCFTVTQALFYCAPCLGYSEANAAYFSI
jgi:hypothetical protein